MATGKRSALELDALADAVVDETEVAARVAGGVESEDDVASLAVERLRKIELIAREHQVPKAIATIMADTGYSKGTANRIYNDTQKRERQAREAAQAAKQAKSAKQPPSANA